MLQKYAPDSSHLIMWTDVPIQEDVSYQKILVYILEHEVKALCRREILLVKILWQHKGVHEATWELESEMLEHFPHIFL